jgi:hypothetical protein
MTNEYGKVLWPAQAYRQKGGDLAAPMVALLTQLNVLEDADELKAPGHWKTPPSLQAITAGASSFSKWMAGVLTALGGSTVVWGLITRFWVESGPVLQVTYVAAMAVLLSVIALAIAMIVRADVTARAIASAAEYQARSRIATSFIEGAVTPGLVQRPAEAHDDLGSLVKGDSPAQSLRLLVITESEDRVPT